MLQRAHPLTPTFPPLDLRTLRTCAYADCSASPQTPAGRHHQGNLVALTDGTHRFALHHWESRRLRRTVHSTGGGELLAFADAIRDAVHIRNLLQELLGQDVFITAYTDASAAYNCVVAYKESAELCSNPNAVLLRQALVQGTLAEVCRTDSAGNPADALSKPSYASINPNTALANALATGYLVAPVRAATTNSSARNPSRPGFTFKVSPSRPGGEMERHDTVAAQPVRACALCLICFPPPFLCLLVLTTCGRERGGWGGG